jgi:hypothetical protein
MIQNFVAFTIAFVVTDDTLVYDCSSTEEEREARTTAENLSLTYRVCLSSIFLTYLHPLSTGHVFFLFVSLSSSPLYGVCLFSFCYSIFVPSNFNPSTLFLLIRGT